MMWKASRTRAPAAAALALTLAACNQATSPYKPTPLEELEAPAPATVRPGDQVVILFWQQADISGEVIVAEDGTIQVPLLSDVPVEGLTAKQIRDALSQRYREFFSDPIIMVNIKLGVTVSGAVDNPGRFLVDPGFVIFDVLGLAGGVVLSGKRSGVILYRDGKAYKVHLNKAALGTDPANLRLQSGDWIYVPTRIFTLQRIGAGATIVILLLTIANFFVN
ncbi:MAG: polysaccharide biosynthesis/export family protein [Gemmatimonadota bacterium]